MKVFLDIENGKLFVEIGLRIMKVIWCRKYV